MQTMCLVRLWVSVLSVCITVAGVARAEEAKETERVVRLEVGHQKVFPYPQPIEQVAVGDPEVADVRMLSRKEALITGKKAGTTSLMIWQKSDKDPRAVTVLVSPSTTAITDTKTVDFEGQVQTDVKIVEVSRTALKQTGFNFNRITANSVATLSPPGALSSIESNGIFNLMSSSGFLPIPGAFNLAYGNARDGFLAVLSILQQNGLAYVLAEPSLVAMSGHTASFLAGGEFPIPVVQNTGGTSGGSITIEFREFGIRLILAPTVLGSDRIMLKVAPEVSELDFTTAVQSAGVAVPGLTIRRSETTIEVGDSESFVISGLVSRSILSNVDKVPWLGDIPVLGHFFKSKRFKREDKELIMVVTPHLVRPLAKGAPAPPLPGEEYKNYGSSLFNQQTQQNYPPGFAR